MGMTMSNYALTGGATGIGAAVKKRLRDSGHNVIVVDIKDADIVADLSTAAGGNPLWMASARPRPMDWMVLFRARDWDRMYSLAP